MNRDYRMELIQSVQGKILAALGAAAAETVATVLTVELENYEIGERCTALVPYDDENERILKRYLACLMIDGKSEKTVAAYSRTIVKMTEFLRMNYTEIGTYDIRLYLAYEKNRGVSNVTLENTRANISAFFQWMTAEEVIGRNPCSAIKPIKRPSKERQPFSPVELDAMRSACQTTRERALIEVLASSGVRVSELVALDVEDVEIPSMTVHVKRGKGGKARATYINEIARTHLTKYLRETGVTEGPIFLNAAGDRLRANGVRYILNQIAKRAGVENVHPHRFRRTFATGLAERGMPVQEIMRLLGHSKIDTTMGYVSLNDEKVKAAYKQYIA